MIGNDTQPTIRVTTSVKLTVAQIIAYAGGLVSAVWYLSNRLASIENQIAVLQAILRTKGIIP